MVTKLGICSILIGFFVGIFSGISNFMKIDNFWVGLTISKFTGEYSDTIVKSIPVEFVENGLHSLIYDIPLAVVAVGLGVLLLIIGIFLKQH
ncbi:MAG: hypothetical protein GY710_05795 [Desulfobacteraceae bacterium]|nr:hypothetical protein [Desulfobacteraceae bacterium]